MDLNKIKAFQLPSVEKEIFIIGEMQKFTIHAMKDTTSARFSEFDPEDKSKHLEFFKICLADILRISEEDALAIAEADLIAAQEIVTEGQKLTSEYNKKRQEERENARKNSLPEQVASTQD